MVEEKSEWKELGEEWMESETGQLYEVKTLEGEIIRGYAVDWGFLPLGESEVTIEEQGKNFKLFRTVEKLEEKNLQLPENISCPCTHIEPCHPDCSCVKDFSSRGCRRCATYGSKKQQIEKSKILAKAIDEYYDRKGKV